jgi:hypothetical protein
MAERPVYVPRPYSSALVEEVFLSLTWNPGFASVQKDKNIKALHEAAAAIGIQNVLEVSSKSDSKRGQHLSAFYLKVQSSKLGEIPLESAFQGSKVFANGGPYIDLYRKGAREAKTDPRIRDSGPIVAFEFEGKRWPIEPKTVFYDWLYIGCLYPHRVWAMKLTEYGGFSDIEFNPYRSINCQARSIALFLSLLRCGKLDAAVRSPEDFIGVLVDSDYRPQLRTEDFLPRKMFTGTR